jgi:hypothetical protein
MSYGKIFPLGGSGGSTSPSGIAGAIQFSNGSAFASDAANLFWDDTNNRLGVGTNAPTSPLQVVGTITTQNLLTSGVIYGGSFWLQENGILALGQQSAGPSKFFVKGSGSTSATTSLLVQNSAGFNAIKVVDDRSVGMYAFSQLCLNSNADTNSNGSMRFLVLSNSGNAYIDGWSDGTGKAQNYPLVIGSRVNNLGSSLTGNTTTENGTPVIFGFEVAQASALVTMNSTTRGFLPPRMLQTQRTAIASPAVGLIVYQTDATEGLYIYKSTGWTFIV